MNSYVYKHKGKIHNDIFYIGIGTGTSHKRAYSENNRNKRWKEYVSFSNGFNVEIISSNLTRKEACELEIDLIKMYGREVDGGCLVNLSKGGGNGLYGIPRTKEHQDKISKANTGKKASLETRKKQSLRKLGKKLSPSHIKNMSNALKGKVFSKETRSKISSALTGVKRGKQSPEFIKKRFDAINKNNPNGMNVKSVLCLTNNKKYTSIKAAAKDLGISPNHIPSVCTGKRPHTHNYKFMHI